MPDSAVLMIDMQNGYLADDGLRDALGWPPIWRLGDIIGECARLLDTARAAGVPVLYSRQVTSPAGSLAANPRSAGHLRSRRHRLPDLSPQHTRWRRQIMEAVAPQPNDIVLDKTRHSFFAYTELAPVLKSLGVQRLIVAGLQTNVCVEATVRAALEYNYDVAVAEDAVSTDGPDLHHGALNSMRVLYVEVAGWRELLAPGAPWDRAYTTANYGRNPDYWTEPTPDH
ncbi:cysteine hydrolase family protein [Nocardia wallacei]|uniref:Peroxyureidoacrylate/ureidoacrylate amidohydrolase RutB n=1 Tax=Nocardia wallacei TaxID=480035 RepID=A0A7G1KI75_9NOCA|nr:isochorismatase family cysteine hydrolase [Nocardia wallacei]BCK54808.1 peroxyureidoacrylate/ureidoacrylate amidohydrolase RutB [Nocardia wallacei]